MIVILIYIVVFCVYFSLPLPGGLLMCLINFMIPDFIPFIDEAIMVYGVISKLLFLGRAVEFGEDHPVLSKILVLAIPAGIVLGVIAVFAAIF